MAELVGEDLVFFWGQYSNALSENSSEARASTRMNQTYPLNPHWVHEVVLNEHGARQGLIHAGMGAAELEVFVPGWSYYVV